MKKYSEMNNNDFYVLGRENGYSGNNKVNEIIGALSLKIDKNKLSHRITYYIYGYKVRVVQRKANSFDIDLDKHTCEVLEMSAKEEAKRLLKKVKHD